VSGRSYLSIGDVLTLLREEFPDVTISKIRFLESQGLVNPERSPSGYRKFFETDVERLRWVLRQQREHFLPLKVIRDRLDEAVAQKDGTEAGADAAPGARRNGRTAAAAREHAPTPVAAGISAGAAAARGAVSGGSRGLGPVGADARAASGGSSDMGRVDDQLTQADTDAMARILADASRRAALLPEGGTAPGNSHNGGERTPLRVVPDPEPSSEPAKVDPAVALGLSAPRSSERPAPSGSPTTAGTETVKSGSAVTDPNRGVATGPFTMGSADRRDARSASAPAPRVAQNVPSSPRADAGASRAGSSAGAGAEGAAISGAPSAAAPTAPAAPSVPAAPAPAAPASSVSMSSMVSGASLTSEELCVATGLSEVELASLQGFGLIEGEVVAGILTFNEDALTVANLASQFRKFGIEPRHLRLYRNSVDRELGLIEQVIIPLLRQRNPESRQRAVESAGELADLGQTMRAALLRAALRRHLGG
jgi:DNA-binding transcriptional MerR regulator